MPFKMGHTVNLGSHRSQTSRDRMRIAHLGLHPSEETRIKMSMSRLGEKNFFYGKHLSEENRAKVAESNRNRHVTATTRDKMSAAHKGKSHPVSALTRAKISASLLGKMAGDKSPGWKGGRVVSSPGYETVLVNPGCYLYIHRMVMAKAMGRKLRKGEIVHHINGIKMDNRPENLALCSNVATHKWCDTEEAKIFLGNAGTCYA